MKKAAKKKVGKTPTLIRVSEKRVKKTYPKELFVLGRMAQDAALNELEAHKTLANAYIDYGVKEVNELGNDYAVYSFKKMVRLVKRGGKTVALNIKPEKKRTK